MITFITKEVDGIWKFFVYKDRSIVLGVSTQPYKNELHASVAARNHIFQKYGIRWAIKEKTYDFLT